MERLTLPQEAAQFKFIITAIEIAGLALLLMFLMAFTLEFLSSEWWLTLLLAVILAFMVKEDAREQTVDLYLLSILGFSMFMIAYFSGTTKFFLKHTIIGICFFRSLLSTLSLWLTLRSVSFPSQNNAIKKDILSSASDENHSIGYLPIFVIVFAISLCLGDSFAPSVFSQSVFIVDIIAELFDFYPALPYIVIFLWFSCEAFLWWLEHKRSHQILWAFGGGDVLFLGLFAGYLGLAPLFALFFLSLLARVVFFLIQFVLDCKNVLA